MPSFFRLGPIQLCGSKCLFGGGVGDLLAFMRVLKFRKLCEFRPASFAYVGKFGLEVRKDGNGCEASNSSPINSIGI